MRRGQMPLEPAQLGFFAILFVAYFVGTALGFGTSVITVTFGVMLLPLDVVLPIVCPLNVALSTYIAGRHRRHILWRPLLTRLVPLVGAGVPIGLWLFNLREVRWLKLGFGVFVIALALMQLRVVFARLQTTRPLGKPWGALMLFGGGIVHGLFSTGGPNIVYVLAREIEDKGAFRSTISAMFVPMSTALLIDYAMLGLFTREVMVAIAWALVPVGGGLWLGEWAHTRFDNLTFKRALWILLLVGGVVVCLRAFLSA